MAHLLGQTLMNPTNVKACCLPITEFIVVFLKWFLWPSSPQTEFHIGDHIGNTIFCEMVKLAHLFLSLLTWRQGNSQTWPSPLSRLNLMHYTRESHHIYFQRLFPFTRGRTNCFGKRSQSSHRDFSVQTQLMEGYKIGKSRLWRKKRWLGHGAWLEVVYNISISIWMS